MRKAKGESCEIQAFNIMGNTLAYLNPVVAICAHCEATVAYFPDLFLCHAQQHSIYPAKAACLNINSDNKEALYKWQDLNNYFRICSPPR